MSADNTNLTGKAAMDKARAEIVQDKIDKASKLYKSQLILIDNAEAVVRNLKRELEEIEHEMNEL